MKYCKGYPCRLVEPYGCDVFWQDTRVECQPDGDVVPNRYGVWEHKPCTGFWASRCHNSGWWSYLNEPCRRLPWSDRDPCDVNGEWCTS